MIRVISHTEVLEGTCRRRVFLFEDDGEDAIMTDEEYYESEEEAQARELDEFALWCDGDEEACDS
jgi:hypothetical protein